MKRRRASDGRRCRRIVPALLALLAGAVAFGCSQPERDPPPPPEGRVTVPDSTTIEAALAENANDWMAIDGVEGLGIGRCDEVPCIKVFVSRPPNEFADVLPGSVHGHPVRLEPTGRIEVR